ncbi:hypothetical protein KSP39_PZI006456 [Platanthera zijinensis]|uniref:Uncharacterized protein n=1 Tax=Platanthera zijinensis TaxID=2320716 RepID=A0AAP0BRA2_9ASPA
MILLDLHQDMFALFDLDVFASLNRPNVGTISSFPLRDANFFIASDRLAWPDLAVLFMLDGCWMINISSPFFHLPTGLKYLSCDGTSAQTDGLRRSRRNPLLCGRKPPEASTGEARAQAGEARAQAGEARELCRPPPSSQPLAAANHQWRLAATDGHQRLSVHHQSVASRKTPKSRSEPKEEGDSCKQACVAPSVRTPGPSHTVQHPSYSRGAACCPPGVVVSLSLPKL